MFVEFTEQGEPVTISLGGVVGIRPIGPRGGKSRPSTQIATVTETYVIDQKYELVMEFLTLLGWGAAKFEVVDK